MAYWGLKEDGTYAIAKGEETFIEYYEKNWNSIMADVYYPTELLNYGHKFRPRLVYWGYCAGKSSLQLTQENYNSVAQVAISIELVHKASTLLDDYIDGDMARHGMEAFHVTHGPERTMIYSLNILCRSLRIINDVLTNFIDDSTYSKISMQLVIQTLEDMTLGVLKELDLNNDISIQEIEEIKEIMHLETATLITNSLLVGYLLSQNTNTTVLCLFNKIGKDLGYIFQILNDLEPFCSLKNNDHKGSLNTDISRHRKNICIPVIYAFLNMKEKKKIKHSPVEERDSILLTLFQKYNIKQHLFDEISNTCDRIHTNIDCIPITPQTKDWRDDFHTFVESAISVSKKRLD